MMSDGGIETDHIVLTGITMWSMGHCHVSQLYELFPSNLIPPNATPELAAAARETLQRHGDGGTVLSCAWKMNF